MKQRILPIILISLCLLSCTTDKPKTKYEQIQHLINTSGFIKLPLIFDANNENALNINYSVNPATDDSLLFEYEKFDIVGFLPDTTNYYAFLYLSVGDMLYPTIVTMDKNWQKIDEKVICTTGCAGHAQLDVTSCYDSVWIYKDLKIKSISKVIGTVEMEDDSTSQVLNICNMRILEGFIDKNGKINTKESNLINCNE
jgi:hypothetical protein